MIINNVLKLDLNHTVLENIGFDEKKKLYDTALKFMRDNMYIFYIDGEITDDYDKLTFVVFNICVSSCIKLATVTMQDTFLYNDISKSGSVINGWVIYNATDKSKDKVNFFMKSMNITQYRKYVYDSPYAMTFKSKEYLSDKKIDFYIDTGIGKKIVQVEADIKDWCKNNNIDVDEMMREIRWSINDVFIASSRYYSRGKLWKKVFSHIRI